MIVTGYNEMKPFLPNIGLKGEPDIFNDALETAQDTLVEMIIGPVLEERLELREASDQQLLTRCQRIIAADALLRSIPELDLILTDAGFGVVSNQSFAPASRDRVQNLMNALQSKADEGRDRLVTYLLRTEQYDNWRGSEEFARLSDGLILTLAEFRDAAVFCPATAETFPLTWADFLKLNGAMNVALTTIVASYISPEYADELLEKIRDKETMMENEKRVLKVIKTAIAALALGDQPTGVKQAIKAAQMMRNRPGDFPTFMASSAARDLSPKYTDTPIFSLI